MSFVIGILGGMGPRATVQFEQLLLDKLPGNDQELPMIITINDGRIPDRSSFLLGKGEDPVPQLLKNLELLENAGASIICVPCNTACAPLILSRLQNQTMVPIINLPEEVGRKLTSLRLRKIFILATEGTIKSGLYQNICEKNDVEVVVPSCDIQKIVDKVIGLVKTNDLSMAHTVASDIRSAIKTSDAQGVILGCTELPVLSDILVPQECVQIGTLEVLANATLFYSANATVKSKEIKNDPR